MKDYGGLIMPSVASVKKDLEALGITGQEEILNSPVAYISFWYIVKGFLN